MVQYDASRYGIYDRYACACLGRCWVWLGVWQWGCDDGRGAEEMLWRIRIGGAGVESCGGKTTGERGEISDCEYRVETIREFRVLIQY